MDATQLKAALSALIFASEEPVSIESLVLVLEEAAVDKKTVAAALEAMQKQYQEDPTAGWSLREVAGGYQFVTKADQASWIQKLNAPKPKSLSQAALETLAIVAYRQPVIRPEIEEIRGVDSGGVLKTLLERGWIRIVGRRDEPGTPLIYGTTPSFLELFGLRSLEELPALKSIEEMAEAQANAVDAPLEPEEPEEETEVISGDEEGLSTPANDDEDELGVLGELEEQMKTLRKLEKEIFPKPETQDAVTDSAGETASITSSEDSNSPES